MPVQQQRQPTTQQVLLQEYPRIRLNLMGLRMSELHYTGFRHEDGQSFGVGQEVVMTDRHHPRRLLPSKSWDTHVGID